MITFGLFCAAALACALAAVVVSRTSAAVRRDRMATATALVATSLWCGARAALGAEAAIVHLIEVGRNIAWIYALYRHFANDGRHETMQLVRQVIVALVAVEALQLVLLATDWRGAEEGVSALLRMLVAVGALFLVHNLFGGASATSRRLLAWNSAGFALFWLFELNLFTVAYLSGGGAGGLVVLRAVMMIAVATAFAVGGVQTNAGLTFRPSRAVAFSTLSLAVLAFYFLAMVGLASGVAHAAGNLARVTEVGFLLIAATAALVWLPSPRLRSTARVLALKHFFKHRYDYREEWLRFTRTIGSAAGKAASLQERAIQSLADITESSSGLLLMPQDDGELALAARWRWPAIEVPARAAGAALVRKFERHAMILDLDDVRSGIDRFGELDCVPAWLRNEATAWAAVPLLHGERLVGLVVLGQPHVARRLDWEDFDLLGIAGQQIASYLSEQAGHDALQDAARFDEFNRRIAFVMHDIKNLSSQLGLLARNAERHSDNPEFRKDMLVTLVNSAEKLDALVKRLGRYGGRNAVTTEPVDLAAVARRVAGRLSAAHHIDCSGETLCEVIANEDMLEQALLHLAQNAVDASEPGSPITIDVTSTGLRGEVAVIDAGRGMSAHFVRTGLFRPFVSTKESGFGIGVCEARDHARAMGGRLDVESREGVGSRFTISLPLAEASRLLARRLSHPVTLADEKAA